MSKKEEFKSIVEKKIQRDGIKDLMEWLETTDFYTAPASTKFHNDHEGGLVEHSINVYNYLMASPIAGNYSAETLAIVSLFHDLCKVHTIGISMRNVKNEKTGQWEKQPYYSSDVMYPGGHGEKSVYILMKYMKLSDEEVLAINWHMGGFDTRCKGGPYDLSTAFEISSLAVELHVADLRASYIAESKKKGSSISYMKVQDIN